jgi:hypothetical protein
MAIIINGKRLIRGPGKAGSVPVTFGSQVSCRGQRFTIRAIDTENLNNIIVHPIGM